VHEYILLMNNLPFHETSKYSKTYQYIIYLQKTKTAITENCYRINCTHQVGSIFSVTQWNVVYLDLCNELGGMKHTAVIRELYCYIINRILL